MKEVLLGGISLRLADARDWTDRRGGSTAEAWMCQSRTTMSKTSDIHSSSGTSLLGRLWCSRSHDEALVYEMGECREKRSQVGGKSDEADRAGQ